MIMSLKIAALARCLALLSACNHLVRTEKEMKWLSQPSLAYNGKQWVEFHFVENPNYFNTEVGPLLGDALKSLGKPIITMRFELIGDFVEGYRGESSLGIDRISTPLSDRNAEVESPGTEGPGMNPLKTACDRLARR